MPPFPFQCRIPSYIIPNSRTHTYTHTHILWLLWIKFSWRLSFRYKWCSCAKCHGILSTTNLYASDQNCHRNHCHHYHHLHQHHTIFFHFFPSSFFFFFIYYLATKQIQCGTSETNVSNTTRDTSSSLPNLNQATPEHSFIHMSGICPNQ